MSEDKEIDMSRPQNLDHYLMEKSQRKVISSRITLEDFYHLLYLKPIQCVLDQKKQGLAIGLKIVDRKSQTQYELKQVKPILSLQKFKTLSEQIMTEEESDTQKSYLNYIRSENADNLLCQMKTHGNLEIAICVCMYNEDRSMLNNTLQGIGQNIINLYKQGVDPDKIVVIILQDGIEKMDKSILEAFQVLQSESSIRFNSQKKKDLSHLVDKIKKLNQNSELYGWQGEDNYLDLNSVLFDEEEQKKRNQLRFLNVKKKYDQVRKTLSEINELSKRKNPTPEDLPAKGLWFFKKQCKKFIIQDKQVNEEQNQENLKKYYDSVMNQFPSKIKPLVQDAITKTKEYCQNYINSRSDMSHVSFFRTSQYFPTDSGFSIEEIDLLKEIKRKLLSPKLSSEKKEALKQKHNINVEEINKRLAIKMNIFFVIKYRNNQKLSSHNWFFNGFCKQFSNWEVQKSDQNITDQQNVPFKAAFDKDNLSPKYTILLDVGLKPESQALCKMYNTMVRQQDIGGVCGYMGLKIEKNDEENERQLEEKIDFVSSFFLHFVDIQRAQQIEYHFAHLIDKGFQSSFKFIHVLPGAFSGYNMKAIWGINQQRIKPKSEQVGGNADKLLKEYFKSIDDKLKNSEYKEEPLSLIQILCRILLPDFLTRSFISPVPEFSYEGLMYQSNVYLAEDRILCMGIHKNGFDLMFLPDAYSFVDPVKDIPTLMGQRKRWINGSYFAFQKVANQFREMGCCQILSIQIWYLALMNMLAFIAPGFFMFSISVAMQVVRADILAKYLSDLFRETSQIFKAFVYTINFVYAMLIMGLIYFSINLTNKNQRFVKFVYALSTILGTMSVVMMVILVVDLARGLTQGSSYLISNNVPEFVQSIPGGQNTVDIVRYVVLGIMGLYAVPILFYTILFCNIRVLCQILMGAVSFSFYSPTYLIILNIYALCRMDDLSWGTKGLEAGGSGGKDDKVLNNWRVVKTIHVAKLVFWNVVVAGLLIHFGSDYLVRFYLTLALMIIIATTMAIKVLLAIFYYFGYKTCIRTSPEKEVNEEKIEYKVPCLYKDFIEKTKDQKSYLETLIGQEIDENIKKVQSKLVKLKDQVDPQILEAIFTMFQNCTSNKPTQPKPKPLFNVKKPLNRRNRLEPLPTKTTNLQPKISNVADSKVTPKKTQKNQSLNGDMPSISQRRQLFTPLSEQSGSRTELIGQSTQKLIYKSVADISLGVDEVGYDEEYSGRKGEGKNGDMRKISERENESEVKEMNKPTSSYQIKVIEQNNEKEENDDGNQFQFIGSLIDEFKQKISN